jgi:fatty-acyl-CoA synthase
VTSELAPLSINYTSGTTGRPKGAVYLHRGAYLQGLAMAYHARLDSRSVYLWTLPMFHCNGWSFPWAVTAAGGTHVCMPRVEPAEAWRLIEDEGVSHLCGAPTVLTMLMDSTPVDGRAPGHRPLEIFTGGAPPSPTLIARAEPLGINITHLYGLTETYGPAVICEWQPEWDLRNETDRSVLRARQGVANIVTYPVRVMDDEEHDVARDGESLGEVVLRGNTVMSGYYRAPDATLEATPAGWFRTGDLAVVHEDGYLELRDRRKDIIVSGGENIASIELEQAIVAYPGVADAAVVAMADELWGERPVAFVTVSDGAEVTSEGLVAYLRERLAHFKVPARIVFAEIPKTPTGKAKKYLLREYLRQYPA